MRKQKLLAALLVFAMVLTALPATVFAAEDTTGSLFLDKTAVLTNDGTYTIDLEAYATGTPVVSTVTEGIPLDIVLVIDQSGSMYKNDYLESLKTAVTNFVNSVADNGRSFNVNHRIAITAFANDGEGSQSGTEYASTGLTWVGQKDPTWGNTGLFHSDGSFENYGTAVYEEISSSDISTSDKYYVCLESDDGTEEYIQIFYYNSRWRYYESVGSDSYATIGTTSTLFNTYTVYEKTGETLNLDGNDYADAWMNVSSGANGQGEVNAAITKAIGSFASNGSTYTSYGLEMAKEAMANLPASGEERNKLVVVFTDGLPGYSGFDDAVANPALAASAEVKAAGAEVYTIGLYSSADSDTTTFMNYMSSNYGDVINMDGETNGLVDDSTEVSYKAVSSASVSMSSNGTIETDYYVLDGGVYYQVSVSRSGYSSSNRTYTWYYTDANGERQTICTRSGNTGYNGSVTLYTKSRKYYQTTSDMTKLNDIFQTITVDSTTTDTTIALGVDAVVRDVMAAGFSLTDDTVITVKTQAGSYSGSLAQDELTEDKITWGATTTVATLNYAPDTTVTENGYTITVTDSTVDTHGSSVDVTGFNFHEQYICSGHSGSRLLITITGVEADTSLATDTQVFTNHGSSGVFEPATSDVDGDGVFGEAQGSFVNPTTYFTTASYVMDYAKSMTAALTEAKLASAVNLDQDGYHGFASPVTSAAGTYGNAAISGSGLTYDPTTINWNGYDSFFIFGTTADETVKAATANANGNVWSKVNVIPANNVYYEDTFVSNETAGTVGIEYTGEWTEGTASTEGENAESGEDTTGDNQGGVQGWEDALANDTGDSDGSVYEAVASASNLAKATFTFTGTGVDIYSRTTSGTGTILVMVQGEGVNKALAIDTVSVSDTYYNVPTASFYDLPHGEYNVTIMVTTAAASENRYTYYLDGIRVYNPIQDQESDETVSGAYGDELNATFQEIRDILIDAQSFSDEEGTSIGVVFIDVIRPGDLTDDTTTEEGVATSTANLGTYETYGPENGVYLAKNQAITFAVNYSESARYFVGLQAPNGATSATVNSIGGLPGFFDVAHSADLFYEVEPVASDSDGDGVTDCYVITIGNNNSDNLLGVTKLKVTDPNAVSTASVLAEIPVTFALRYTAEVYDTDAVEAPVEPDVPEETPEQTPEEEVPGETPDVEIENPEEEPSEEDNRNLAEEFLKKLFKTIIGWLRP